MSKVDDGLRLISPDVRHYRLSHLIIAALKGYFFGTETIFSAWSESLLSRQLTYSILAKVDGYFPILHQIDFCLPPSYLSFMRSYSIRFHPSWASQRLIAWLVLILSRTPAIWRRRQKSEIWGLMTGQARCSIYDIWLKIDFMGSMLSSSEIILWHFPKML